jgi:ABC-type branched-subunit amino acid transport system substrate-binding protein
MNEIDHILYIAGVTSPEAIDPYLRDAPCVSRVGKQDCPGGASKGLPFIGDFGLSPKSYTNPMIFPVIPNYETTIALLTKAAFEDFHMKTFSVIWGTLPGVDTTPIRGWWEGAAKRFGIKMLAYRDMASTDSDCSAQWGAATTDKPEFVFVPVATGAMLACLRAAKQNGQQPNTPGSPWLKGWFGGSGLQVEVDNCAPTCEGMLASTVFRDARTYNTPPMDAYRRNMARYAPNVDITGFIPINYYHTGWVVYNLLKGAGITSNLTRKTLFDAANHFGPFETGFGDTITWTTQLPRTPTVCGYRIYARGDKWVYDDRKNCL